jgi:hypothetical protein
VDARVIQDRLDDVLGVMGWQDSYESLPDGAVTCRLKIRVGDRWITKMDVGGQSEQPDEGDRRKAAFSDALKRAAVKFGIGRYLYRLEGQWVDYDPQKKKILGTPRLPQSALPKRDDGPRLSEPASTPVPDAIPKALPARGRPASGAELKERLTAHDARLAREGVCKAGDLLRHIEQQGVKAGHGKDMATWNAAAINLAIEQTRVFEADQRKAQAPAAKAG